MSVREDFAGFCKHLRKSSNSKLIVVEEMGKNLDPAFYVDNTTVPRYEAGTLPTFPKILTLAKAYGVPVSRFYRAIGGTDAEICGHTLTSQQQAVVDQLNTDNGEYLLKLSWIFAEGRDHHREILQGLIADFSKEAPADDLTPPEAVTDLTDPDALAGPKIPAKILKFPASLTPDVLPVPLREEVRAAAGSGAIIDNEAVMGYLPFRRDWLTKHGINNMLSSVIEVIGDSMEPNLQSGAWILVDHQRVRRLGNRIFVLGTEDGTIVKRLAHDNHHWQLLSDNKNYKPLPWPQTATVIGQVMWAGRTL